MSVPWYETFFDERYLDFYPGLRARPVAERDAAFVCAALSLEPGDRVLDLGCGTGRHAVALAERGLTVTGLDLSPALLAHARETAAERGVEVTWLERDMRDLDDLGPFDAVVSLFTAFGLIGEAGDQEVLHQVRAALRPGGQLLLDLTNFARFLRRFSPQVWHESDQAVLQERHHYEAETGTLVTERVGHFKRGGTFELPTSRVRAYFPHEVRALLRRAGLRVERVYGALSDVRFDWASSPNQVYRCRRPEETGEGADCAG